MPRKEAGFTLIEIVIALAVLGICLGIAVPAYLGAVAATHAGAARTALGGTLLSAMTQSTITGMEFVVCASADGADCNGSTDWSTGWIAFADPDADRARGAHETVMRRESALPGDVRLRSTVGRTRIVFQPHGGAAAGSNVTFTLCDRRGPAKAATLVLANSGRLRQGAPSPTATLACPTGG
ncbi:MAG TPA: GspH/FimT family pseudopilin [Luteimonas sp.]|nr:GspH/FimT family pseudopilin [Luteimonas sp.]